MLTLEQAREIIIQCVKTLDVEIVPLADSLHRTLAEPLHTDVDDPPFDKSVMDGFAVRAADVKKVPVTLRGLGTIGAGHPSKRSIGPGEALRINTGAPIPEGADAVVRVEETELIGEEPDSELASGGEPCAEERVSILKSVESGKFITRRGSHIRNGDLVLDRGIRLTPLAMGAAAAAGAARVSVYQIPKVAILTTGDELVSIDQKPQNAQIRNSNESLLTALVVSAHTIPVSLGVVGDDKEKLKRKVAEGLSSDVLCITGGISMGSFDYVPEILESCGAEILVHKVAIKPGRPIIFATGPMGTLIFALPGNPASALVGFELLVRPVLAEMQGCRVGWPVPIRAKLKGPLSATRDRQSYFPARAKVDEVGQWAVEPLSWKGSGDSFGMARANALIERPPNTPSASVGESVFILPLERN